MKTMLVAVVLGMAACGGTAIEGPDQLRPCESDAACGALSCVDMAITHACATIITANESCAAGTGVMFSSRTITDYPSGTTTTTSTLYCVPTCEVDADCPWNGACWRSPNGGLCVPRG